MLPLIYKLAALAQTPPPWDSPDPQTPAPAPSHGMSFSDLQRGFQEHRNGEPRDTHYRNMMFVVIAVIALIGLILHMRQRHKTNEPPSKPSALFREIAKSIHFPFATRILLRLVARSNNLPPATLLISQDLFESSLKSWHQRPTLTPFRNWAAARLNRLHPMLFGS